LLTVPDVAVRKKPPPPQRPQHRRLFLKQHREALGFTLEEVGARMGGKNKSYVSRIERGVMKLNEIHIFSFAQALGIAPERLFRPPDQPTLDDMVSAIPEEFQASIRQLVATHYQNRQR
jgi:transcriptional regulator with XRE-family HTH domain